jgi:nucleoside-diphosphate-sugar epimerase
MGLPRIVVTGASGFVGRHLLDALKEEYQILAMARRSQLRCGAPFHDNISWFQVDIAEREGLAQAFRAIRKTGGADSVIHLAGHYDFTGENHQEYWRTNVDGMRNLLEECAMLKLRRFVFASSVAACNFPPAGQTITESSPPDGEHIYSKTKKIGEQMLAEYDDRIPSCIVRLAALFSDWCEYPPLYFFLDTWLSNAWNSRVLGGRGASAIPYLHVRDAISFLRRTLAGIDRFEQREILTASPDGAVSHRELFDLSTLSYFGERRKPFLMPKLLCHIGVRARDLLGRLLGNRPFERPWMIKFLDLSLAVDAAYTRRRLDWVPRPRLQIDRRIPFMVERLKTEPVEWHRRNQAAMKEVHLRKNLRIHRLLEKHQDEIRFEFMNTVQGPEGPSRFPSYQSVSPEILDWRYVVVLRHLLNAVRTGEKGIFTAYCRDLAEKRYSGGFGVDEVCCALDLVGRIARTRLLDDPESRGLESAIWDHVTMTIQFGCDQVQETFEDLVERAEVGEASFASE